MYEVRIHRESLKVYKRLSSKQQEKIDEAIEYLAADPWRRDIDIKKLHGEYAGYYRLRVGDIRIIYTVDKEANVIFIDGIAHRGSAYR